jgi:hypothetical protein
MSWFILWLHTTSGLVKVLTGKPGADYIRRWPAFFDALTVCG